ncbi:MAG: hypothetical protein CVU65_12965 [Deltaproteobacteria bacterium HGW-Deltaproteobacteria-22]|nr:MAG: hypothetical protein CVU65_12965 [Deltaproteobacteria bacterium HGW-Deltaproteobacteria-22]
MVRSRPRTFRSRPRPFYAQTFPDSSVDAVHLAPGDYPSGKQGKRPDRTHHQTVLFFPLTLLSEVTIVFAIFTRGKSNVES